MIITDITVTGLQSRKLLLSAQDLVVLKEVWDGTQEGNPDEARNLEVFMHKLLKGIESPAEIRKDMFSISKAPLPNPALMGVESMIEEAMEPNLTGQDIEKINEVVDEMVENAEKRANEMADTVDILEPDVSKETFSFIENATELAEIKSQELANLADKMANDDPSNNEMH